MSGLRIVGGRILTPGGWISGDVEMEGGAISAVRPGAVGADGGEQVDASGLLVVPGLIDLQINGGFGHDFTSGPESIWEVGAVLPRFGVTAFVPTIVSAPLAIVRRALEVVGEGPPAGYAGARVLGLHCEGPMLAPLRRGAHDPRYLREPSADVIEGWTREASVRMVTLAPELDGSEAVLRALVDRGIVVSLGHSDATFEQSMAAFDAGATTGTHLFNAMSGLDHRAPGLAGALLATRVTTASLIADGVHVHQGAVRAAWRAKGPGEIALVTDAVSAMGLGSGKFSLGDTPVQVDGAVVREPGGRLAGSVLTLDQAVRNTVRFTGCDPGEAIVAASSTPSRVLGETRRGVVEVGAAGDLVLLDQHLQVMATVIDGQPAFDSRLGQLDHPGVAR